MTVRRLAPEQAAEYRALMLEGYAAHPDAFTSSVAERAALPLDWWQARLSQREPPQEVVFGAFDDQKLAGAAGLSFEPREKARHKAHLFGMYVPPRCRGRGFGRALVEAALAYARSRDHVRIVQLTVTKGNASAESLYERCGFVAFGVEPYAVAVGNDYVSKVHMWCDLGRTPLPRSPAFDAR
jgi:ribosomal protein S18 acetylase RimI-like enzyme